MGKSFSLFVIFVTFFLLLAVPRPTDARQSELHPAPRSVPGLRYTAKGEVVVPMIFPVLGACHWSDTWGAPRDGGARKHQGQDLPAPKMRPLVACFDGVWFGGGIEGDNGCSASYMHINNDTPGTDDGRGGEEFAYAPGIQQGTRVKAGQHVAYCGDSGNAEATISHLHFELRLPGHGTINAAASLRAATRLTKARYPLPPGDNAARPGELRMDGEVVQTDAARGVLQIRVAAWSNARGKVTPQTRPLRRWIQLSSAPPADFSNVEATDFVAVWGKDPGRGTVTARAVTLLQPGVRKRRRLAQSERQGRATAATAFVGRRRSGVGNAFSGAPLAPRTGFEAVSGASGVSPVTMLADFETNDYAGWQITGDCWGAGPEGVNFAGATLSGWGGQRFATTAHRRGGGRDASSGTGRAVSAPFTIPADAAVLRFRIGGGRYEAQCCLNLIVDDIAVRSATDASPYRLQMEEWDLNALRGKTARLEIRDDRATGAHAYVHVDEIALVRAVPAVPAQPATAP